METERIILTTPVVSDKSDFILLKTNEEGRKHLGGPVAKKDLEERFAEILSAISPECYWIARNKQTGTFIGLASITLYHDKKHYEISYELIPDQWGVGYGTEIMKKVIDHAFQNVKLAIIYAETQKKNGASVKLLEKLGMEHIDSIHRFGEEQVVYAMNNPYSPATSGA